MTRGFRDQVERSDRLLDNWDLYNCVLNDKQFYNGTSQIYLPFVHDAVNARATRFGNQLFPQSGRYVAVTTTETDIPQATMSLLNGYVRKAKLQTQVVPPLLAGTATSRSQYNIYVEWLEENRKTTRRVTVANTKVNEVEFPDLGTSDDYVEDEDDLGRPAVEVLHDADVLILPVTACSVDDAIAQGGSVTILRHWSKGRIRQAVSDGIIDPEAGERLIDADEHRSAK